MKEFLRKFTKADLFKSITWIFFGNVLYSLFKFLLDAFVARFLSLNDNGMLGYATSLIELAAAVSGLGFAGILTREFVEDEEKAGETLCSCIVSGVVVALAAMALLQGVVRVLAPGEQTLMHMPQLTHFSAS